MTASTIEQPEQMILRSRPLAQRAVSFQSSIWQEIDALAERYPEAIYFGSGAPAPDLLPVKRLQDAAARTWSTAGDFLGYGETHGYRPLRELISRRMGHQGMEVDPANILITAGSQQAIDLVAKLFLDPGDLIVVEGPTYPGAMQAFDACGARYLTIPVDEDGLDVEALALALDQLDQMPKLIYTIPTFQNPSGATMPLDRREQLLALARDRQIVVVEDDPYSEIFFDQPPEPALRALDDNVIYLGTFSKTIAPGFRVGWVVAPPDLISMLLLAKEATDIHSDRTIMRTVYHAAEGFLDQHVEDTRQAYRQRRDILLAGLEEHMPAGSHWSRPGGGFFVWATLPSGIDSETFMPFAAERGVILLPSSCFYPDRDPGSSIRLSFTGLTPDQLTEGARRLGHAIREYLNR
jgi:2-aminoadipate transaminase